MTKEERTTSYNEQFVKMAGVPPLKSHYKLVTSCPAGNSVEVQTTLSRYYVTKQINIIKKNISTRARAFVLAVFLVVLVSLSAQENETKETYMYSNITELGIITTSPMGIGIEITTANGVSVDKQHHFGLGIGIGACFHRFGGVFAYMPVFFNYRYYFKPEKTFSPHMNASIGGIALVEGYGIYSSITMGFKTETKGLGYGFRAGNFSFSTGLSFTPVYRKVYVEKKYFDRVSGYMATHSEYKMKWTNLFGIVIKCGFSF
jgi:hypothetical protein